MAIAINLVEVTKEKINPPNVLRYFYTLFFIGFPQKLALA
jgi:hypothetical protein